MNSEEEVEYKIGDVVLAPFPFTDHSKTKLRPAVVVSELPKDAFLVIYITSADTTTTEFDTKMTPNKTNNLQVPSIIRVNRMTVISKDMVTRVLGTVTENERKRIVSKIELLGKNFKKN